MVRPFFCPSVSVAQPTCPVRRDVADGSQQIVSAKPVRPE